MVVRHFNQSKKFHLGTFETVKALPKELLTQYHRAGVFLYIQQSTERYYFLPVQLGSQRRDFFIRDFCGHVEDGEHPCDAALRELDEESLGVFKSMLSPELINSAPVHAYQDNFYIFVDLTGVVKHDPKFFVRDFDQRLAKLPADVPECFKETHHIMLVPRKSILSKIPITHHVKLKNVYFGPNLWKTLRAFVFLL
jgi:hypothetical protein